MKNSSCSKLLHVERVNKLSKNDFLRKYGIPGKPVIITNLMDNWKAKTRWTTKFFKCRYGDIKANVQRANTPNDWLTMKLSEYMDYMESTDEENPYYLADWHFHDDCPELLKDYYLPQYFKSWHQQLPNKFKPKLSWFYIQGCFIPFFLL